MELFSFHRLRSTLSDVAISISRIDRWLLGAILAGALLGAQGFTWGRYDCLNLDRMGLRNMTAKGRPWLHPGWFVKPPFYTYMNHFAARVPAEFVSRNLIWLDGTAKRQTYLKLRLALARTLNLFFFAGCIALVYGMAKASFGVGSARVSAWLLATSAGFVPYQVFLTTDLALVFMMLASFACAARIPLNPSMGISVAAGLLAGLAAATKYNGLLVAAALPVAHLLASRENPILSCLKRPAAWACGLAVPIGFLIGNPYSILDWPTFYGDFLYNLKVTPVYNGATSGTSYGTFLRSFWEILGRPGSLLTAAGILAGAVAVAIGPGRKAWKFLLMTAVVVAVYMWQIGKFPRIEVRFVLPMAPFAILLSSSGFEQFLKIRPVALPVFAAIVLYNLACGWWIGELFRKDPRMAALDFAARELPATAKAEVSKSMARIQDLPDRKTEVIKIPNGIELSANFEKMFASDEQMAGALKRWSTKEGPEWFRPEARAARNPGWIFWSTIDLENAARDQYDALFDEKSGYRVVFDGSSPELPWWVYPRYTEFIRNRLTVWKKIQP